MVHFDSILNEIGQAGKAQKIQYYLLCLCVINAGFLSVDVAFFSATPPHHCSISSDKISSLSNSLSFNASDREIAAAFIPSDKKLQKCFMYNWTADNFPKIDNFTNFNQLNLTTPNLISCPDGNEFVHDVYGYSFVSNYYMICDQQWIKTTIKMVFFLGRLCGATVLGQVSDRFGRLPTLLMSVAANAVTGLGLYFSMHPVMVAIFIFLHGMVQVGFMLTCFVLGTELVGPSKRKIYGIVLQIFYAFGMMLTALFAYILPNWKHLALVTSIPSLVFLSYYFFVRESPRWLMSRGENGKALKILQEFAKRNNRQLSESTVRSLMTEEPQKSEKVYTAFHLLNRREIAALTINVWFNWLVNSMVYYGLIFNLENFGNNPYLNMFFMGLVELPGFPLAISVVDRIGRRPLLMSTLLGAGVFCSISGFVPQNNLWTLFALAIIGKFFITISYAVIYFFTAELFPTVVRNIGVGMGSTFARVGGVLSTPILELREVSAPLPMLIFGILSVVAAGLTMLLPETTGKPLIADFNEFYNKKPKLELEIVDERPIMNYENGDGIANNNSIPNKTQNDVTG